MTFLLGVLTGAVALSLALIFSIVYLAIKKYIETLAKLSAEDYYKVRIK